MVGAYPTLLHHPFARTVAEYPDRVALVTDGHRYTYAELDTQVGALARCLERRRIGRGDRVALFLGNSVEAVVGLFAVLRVGACVVPMSPHSKARRLSYILADSEPAGLLAHAALRRTWDPVLAAGPRIGTVIVAGSSSADAMNGEIAFESAISEEARAYQTSGTIDQDLAAIIYTSGSTGEPKGVMLTHRNMLTAADAVSTYLGLRGDDVILCALPLSFDYGLYQLLMSVRHGARLVLERSFAFPATVLQTVQRERVTVFPGVPTMYATLLARDDLDAYDLSSLRILSSTAAVLAPSHIRSLCARFPRARVFSMYGLTECHRVSYLPPEELERRPTSVGKGMPNEEVYLVDEEGQRLPPGTTGELVVRGSHVMRGYWKKPDETARRLRPGAIPGEMVLHTGDLFTMDSDGYLCFAARRDDMINCGGEKVSPREVEDVLLALDGVAEAAVIGVDDATLGQAVHAFVVLESGCAHTTADLVKHCAVHLDRAMVPRQLDVVASLPRTLTEKIDREGLRRLSAGREEA